MTLDNDDALLDALARGEPPPADDDVAVLLSAWQSEIADISPATLRAAQPSSRSFSRPRGAGPASSPHDRVRPADRRPRRLSRPLIVAIATMSMAFGGLAAASATAEPGSVLWPITKLVWADRAESKAAEVEAGKLLGEARRALAEGQPEEAVHLIARAAVVIDRITDAAVRERLRREAIDLLGQVSKGHGAVTPSGGTKGATPVRPATPPPPAGSPGQPTPTPSPSRTRLLPPILPSLLPTWLPSLPILG